MINQEEKKQLNLFVKVIRTLFLLFLIILTYKIYGGYSVPLVDGADLIFHEAGHTLMIPFGWTIYVFGGTLGQLFFPFLFTIYFLKERKIFSSLITAWWIGENLCDISIYISDARLRQLPLISGGKDGHDWNNLLGHYNLLQHDTFIGNIVFWMGIIIMVSSIGMALYLEWRFLKSKTPTV